MTDHESKTAEEWARETMAVSGLSDHDRLCRVLRDAIAQGRREGTKAMRTVGIREAEESEGDFCCATFARLLLEDLDSDAIAEAIK